jgi:hypothetical protein
MEVLQRTANRGSIATDTGYDIENSLKLEADDSQYIDDRHYTAGNRKKLTISFWFKRTELGQAQMPYEQSALQARIYLRSTDDLYITAFENSGWTIITNRLFRDPSAWYHCVFQLDTTQSTAADRMKLWINGQQETSFSSASYPTQNADTYFNTNQSAKVGGGGAGLYFSGYMSEFFFIDDQALQASDFGEYDSDSGIWIPKEYDGTFGGQSYYLEFKNASNLADRSDGLSNGVSLSVQNITSADQATDTPTNNFATYNALLPYNSNGKLIEGATKFYNGSGGADTSISTIAVASGKWYAEFKTPSNVAGGNAMVGVAANSGDSVSGRFLGQDAWSVGLLTDGNYRINNSATSYLGSTWNNTEILSVALDMDNKKVYFAKNGTWGNSGNPATGTNGIALPSAYEDYEWFIGASLVNYTDTFNASYGGYTTISISSAETDENGYGTFEYAPPSGYYALCTKNLAEYG